MKRITVELVANHHGCLRYHSNSAEFHSLKRMKAPIDSSKCETALGCWLADTIPTTAWDDDASRVTLLLPYTGIGIACRNLAKHLFICSRIDTMADIERTLSHVEDWLAKQRQTIKMYGETVCAYLVDTYRWPVYDGHESAEAYFDKCGREIRVANAVILRAGLTNAVPPESLTRTMGPAQSGLTLLAAYEHNKQRQKGTTP